LIDEKLIDLCIQGDNNSQRSLYEHFSIQMFRICYRYVKNESDAEDIMIEGFYKVFRNISKFEHRGDKSLVAWMRKIMVNQSLMFLRKNKNLLLVPNEAAVHVSSDDHPDLQIESEEIYQMIGTMPVGYRTVFNLYVVEGYSHKEIAEKLGISLSTSKSQLSKAKRWMRKILNQNGLAR